MARFLVIAASSAIGGAVVEQLRAAGHTVVTTARNAARIRPDIELDAADFDAVDGVFKTFGPFDGVVNCAGRLLLRAAHQTSRDQYEEVISASLTTAFATVRAAGRHMTAGGSVVLVSSAAAMEGFANHEAIAAAKAGINGLVLSAAATYAGNRLRVNAVAPGLVESPMTEGLTRDPAARKVSEAMHALGRIGRPDDIARLIVFLLDPGNDWITGQMVAVDGGLSRVRPKMRV